MERAGNNPTVTAGSASGAEARLVALEQALAEERAARETAEQASQAKSELLATVSHEVRTPLGAIISMADLLLTTALDETQRHYAETLRQSGRGLLAILNDILDYSKLAAGRVELETVRFDFIELVKAAGEALEARAAAKGLASTIEIDEACPPYLIGDPARIRQILDNLIDNALKFTETGSIRIRAAYLGSGGEPRLRLEVSDTGIGMSDAQRARVFEPYLQGDGSIAGRYGGTGLGLSIAQQLARAMGGDIGCESAAGQGSLFWFTVRAEPAQVPAAGDHGEQPTNALGAMPLSGHVLIVEDNDVNQMLIRAYLDNFGLTHETAENGKVALEMISQSTFDLVLMDIMMPVMDGIEATHRIRALGGPTAKVPIVALTANAMKGDREKYLAAGMDGYVSKPVGALDLFETLAEQLQPNCRRAVINA